jgi:hypothetical protein
LHDCRFEDSAECSIVLTERDLTAEKFETYRKNLGTVPAACCVATAFFRPQGGSMRLPVNAIGARLLD